MRNKLNGMSDEVFMVHVAEGLLGTELNDYIKHVMNTDGIELDAFMQGITERANTVFGQKLLVQASKTDITCQVCGGNDHTYNTCPDVPDEKREEIKEYHDRPRPHDGIKHKYSYCGKRGHTESNCETNTRTRRSARGAVASIAKRTA